MKTQIVCNIFQNCLPLKKHFKFENHKIFNFELIKNVQLIFQQLKKTYQTDQQMLGYFFNIK